MKAPLKLNRAGWPGWIGNLAVADPRVITHRFDLSAEEFSRHLSVLKFGTTFKTTRPGRHKESNRLLAELYRGQRPVVLDVGVSDGSTCLDLMAALDGFARYFATDYHLSVEWAADARGVIFFRDESGRCILRAGPHLVAYVDTEGAQPPLGAISKLLLRGVRRVEHWRQLSLVQPSLHALAAKDQRVVIDRYDLFTPWQGPRPDLIKIANVLNRIYFSEEKIGAVLTRQRALLPEGGRLLLLDNRGDVEQFSLLRKREGKLEVERSFGGGCEVAALA
jgi:hypothetical protein